MYTLDQKGQNTNEEVEDMNQDNDSINQMRAITISRQYGSGGGEIASRLASYLGWRLLDHEIVERVAIEMGTSIEQAEARDMLFRDYHA